ncbi:MAG: hypothetical protein GC151_12330 [Betaproteobacteria bacterium]|nr:hypothetical protein [Betaproteobacteria bacterium]
MPVFLALMAVAMTTAALWLVCLARFLTRLHERDPAVYASLGRPVMRWLWWTAPSNRSTPHPAVLT